VIIACETTAHGAMTKQDPSIGWIEGQTIAIEYRWSEGHTEHVAEIAAEFVRLKGPTSLSPLGVP
jgi:hypothetical protein